MKFYDKDGMVHDRVTDMKISNMVIKLADSETARIENIVADVVERNNQDSIDLAANISYVADREKSIEMLSIMIEDLNSAMRFCTADSRKRAMQTLLDMFF